MTDTDETRLRELVAAAHRIAVVGASPTPGRPSHTVAGYLQRAGYEIIPVRPGGAVVHGVPAVATLRDAAAGGALDIVDVFRRADRIPELLPDLIALRPRLVWLQLGLRHDDVARQLAAAGIPLVQDRCLKVAHSQWGL
jgi:predicted CoA-binding protein